MSRSVTTWSLRTTHLKSVRQQGPTGSWPQGKSACLAPPLVPIPRSGRPGLRSRGEQKISGTAGGARARNGGAGEGGGKGHATMRERTADPVAASRIAHLESLPVAHEWGTPVRASESGTTKKQAGTHASAPHRGARVLSERVTPFLRRTATHPRRSAGAARTTPGPGSGTSFGSSL